MSSMPIPLYTAEQIRTRVAELAVDLDGRFPAGDTPHFIAVLNGSFVTIDFVRMQSYDSGTTTSGTPRLLHGPESDLRDRHIVIVEDIVDTGLTLHTLRHNLFAGRPRSLNTVTLLDKRERRRTDVPVELVGFRIPNRFVVGYGLDHNEEYRHLPYLAVLGAS